MLFIDKYIEKNSLIIYEQIKDKKVIYLDLKYWILLRDNQNDSNGIAAQISEVITQLRETGKCIFPVSEVVFWEVMKQSDDITRNNTLALIEKLSGGLAIIGEHQRAKVEFSHWIQHRQQVSNLFEPKQTIWTTLPLVAGYFFYSKKVEELIPELQESFLSFVCYLPLSQIPRDPHFIFEPFNGKDDIVALNDAKEKYKHENRSFKGMFLSELWGCLDCFKVDINTVMHELYSRKTGRYPTVDEMKATDQEAWCKLIYECFKLDKITIELPMFKIFASLFASMRWNETRKYKDGNDTLDVMHATCALPYFDYFFTERELHTMITQLKLDKTFDCIVESKQTNVLKLLQELK